MSAGISTGFLVNQETRDFRIAKNLDIFFSLFRELNTFYVDEIDPDKVIKSGIDNMLKTLDPYTVYFPESEADEFYNYDNRKIWRNRLTGQKYR